ncbi:MAG: SMP-30/gluconolactonase/LRE family protein [Microbacteriaceae bacterium]
MAQQAVAATAEGYDLAEGVIWDDRAGLVRFVDIWKGRVLAASLHGHRLEIVDELVLGQTAGAIALAEDGGLIIAAARGLAAVAPDGAVSFGPDQLGSRGNVRHHDAAVDPRGRLVVGTLSLVGPTGDEVLLRVSADGSVETLRTGIGLSNGIAFSPDGTLIYHVDTTARTISSRSLDGDEPWQTVVQLEGAPDGLTVDSGGDLWVAQFDGGRVLHYTPHGELRGEVTVDAAQATCPGFVGPGRDILAITTAQENLDDWTDRSGAIFLADVGVTGIPDTRWPGSTTTPYWSTA